MHMLVRIKKSGLNLDLIDSKSMRPFSTNPFIILGENSNSLMISCAADLNPQYTVVCNSNEALRSPFNNAVNHSLERVSESQQHSPTQNLQSAPPSLRDQ